ncbi:MAG: glycosyltransferase family 1 protein [Magnetococcales bacterium]|nr:glycosyltransferase family 1 protein [Magnetococcales bacterium]
MDTTPRLFEIIERLDASDDVDAFMRFVQDSTHDADGLVFAVYHMLGKIRFRAAYLLATVLVERGLQNPFLSIALSLGGLIAQHPAHMAYGLEHLTRQAEVLLTEQPAVYEHVLTTVIDPAMRHLLATALANENRAQILQLLEVLKAFSPRFRTLFDWNAPIPEFSWEGARRQGQEQRAQLLHYPLPPPGKIQMRRVLVVLREFIFPDKSWSRPYDYGPRIVAAMNAYGWHTTFYPLKGVDLVAEAQEIVEACRQQDVELLVLDDDIMMKVTPLRSHLIAQLRQALPSLKIVSILMDAWEPDANSLRESIALVDRVWTVDAPSRPVWRDPAIAPKMLHLPVPALAENYFAPSQPLTKEPRFFGSISGFNWHRAFWMVAFEHARLPVKSQVATHQTDHLPALESYTHYMRGLAEATCCINLTMRANQHCIVTGRSFETPHSGALLLQERSQDMYHFFVPGEHYLEFSTLPELAALIRFVQEHPAEAEVVRQQGHAFVKERYSDEKLIGYLDKALFFPD